MANQVANKQNSALAAAQSLRGNLAAVQRALPESRGAGFMSFGKDGEWSFGVTNTAVADDLDIAINPFSIETGFIAWTDREQKLGTNEVLGEQMYLLGQAVPTVHDMPEKTDQKNGEVANWKPQISVQMRIMSGEHEGVQVKYSTTSVGGISALRGLIDQIMLQLDEDPEQVVPVVNLGADSYRHKQWGKTYTPELNVQDWVSVDDQPDAPKDDAKDAKAAAKDAKAAKAAAENVDEDADGGEDAVEDAVIVPEEDAKPKRRRRQR